MIIRPLALPYFDRMALQSRQEHRLDVLRYRDTADDRRPEFNRRGRYQGIVQAYGIEVVVQIRSQTTVQRVAADADPRSAIPPKISHVGSAYLRHWL